LNFIGKKGWVRKVSKNFLELHLTLIATFTRANFLGGSLGIISSFINPTAEHRTENVFVVGLLFFCFYLLWVILKTLPEK